MRIILFLLSSFLVQTSLAVPLCLPLQTTMQNKNMIMNVGNANLVLLHNISPKNIWLDHATAHPSASAGWSSYLHPGQWSALWLDKKDFSLSCTVIHPGKVDNLNCIDVISVCSPTKVSLSSRRKGSYWLVEDKSADELWKELVKKGIK